MRPGCRGQPSGCPSLSCFTLWKRVTKSCPGPHGLFFRKSWMKANMGTPSRPLAAVLEGVVQIANQTSQVNMQSLTAVFTSVSPHYKQLEDQGGEFVRNLTFFFFRMQLQRKYSIVVKNMGSLVRPEFKSQFHTSCVILSKLLYFSVPSKIGFIIPASCLIK